jgi:hypothetical protein
MPGSPRVERAANIRIQHPNLSTEDAMKLAGYTDEEAKDPKKQSNVRQKTHRLTKGRKRHSTDYFSNPEYKRSLTEDAHPSRKAGSGAATPSEYFHPAFEYERNRLQNFEKVSEKISNVESQQRYLHSQEHPSTPELPSDKLLSEIHRAPGSARAEKAARFWLDNPNLSIENSMKLAGYSEEEFTDTFKQNDIRKTAHIMTVNAAKAKEKKGEGYMSTEIRGKLTAIDHKIDEMTSRLERTVDIRLQELGARIDEKFDFVNQKLSMIAIGAAGTTSSIPPSAYDSRQGVARPQQYQQYPYVQSPYHNMQHPASLPQIQQGYSMPPSHTNEGPRIQQGGMGYPPSNIQQGGQNKSIGPDGKPREMDSTVQL